MSIITQVIDVKVIDGKSLSYYRSKGYILNLQETISINIKDIPRKSKIDIVAKCGYCKNPINTKFNKYNRSIENDKKFACDNCIKIKRAETNIKIYGVNNASKSKLVKDKTKKTNLQKYGVENPYQIQEVRDKVRVTEKLKLNKRYKEIKILDSTDRLIEIYCDSCNTRQVLNRSLIYQRERRSSQLCPICNKKIYKESETSIVDFIKENIDTEIILNSRSIIENRELDIYLPEYKLAIEYNGLYWHSELFKKPEYHINKTNQCDSIGIKLISIFSDEWLFKRDIVKSRILNLLGKSEKIYARKCAIKELKSNEISKFLEGNHIQGKVNSKIKIGLFYNNELVSVISFGPLRVALGGISEPDKYELLRFCNKLNTSVIGGATKMFTYFKNKYKPLNVISYADRRWSTGNLYDKLGFLLIKKTKPNYWNIINNKREYRYKWRKSKLIEMGYDSNKSEHEILKELGYNRIYDCGNLKFEYNGI